MHPFYASAGQSFKATTEAAQQVIPQQQQEQQQQQQQGESSNNDDTDINFQESSTTHLVHGGGRFNKGKRPRVDDSSSDEEDDDDDNDKATICQICFKGMTNQGGHCIVATKCGHTFGESCITRWISAKQKDRAQARCPNCRQNGPVLKKTDLRRIIVTKLVAYDTSDFERVRKELEESKRIIDEKTKEIMSLKGKIKLLNQSQSAKDLQELQEKIVALSSAQGATSSSSSSSSASYTSAAAVDEPESKQKLREFYSYPLEYQQQGRSLAISSMDEMAIVSVGNESRGYGLQRISLRDINSVDFVPNHKKVVRDIKCSPFQQSLVLSTGLDNRLALTCVRNKHVIQAFSLEKAGWSCEFDETDSNLFYCGLANNTVLVYDIRNTKSHLHHLRPNTSSNNFPIHSLASTKRENGNRIILCSNNMGSYLWELDSSNQEPVFHSLPSTDNPGYKPYSLSYDTKTRTILISSRKPPQSNGGTVHSLYQLSHEEQVKKPEEDPIERIWSFESSYPQVQMARTFHFPRKRNRDDIVACFAHERVVSLRNENETIDSFPVKDPVMDIKAKQVGQDLVVGALTDKTLHLYKFQ
ncbi:WD40-repeat-containing domain protein [Zychaea mexicana]|uniref:WD40-repeat-containing domain protein n=1 Tax=Zychaea mexicana TaxID=64656 RepID=UPI0022FE332E|nr:WD40-repeat-containing domain protein [Zychaea mexicana]KAI9492294.1 WD40-repeat-containing domain protein [Zychaea mexicana]